MASWVPPVVDDRTDRRLLRLVWALIGVHLLVWLYMIEGSAFNADEHQHTHLAWQMSQGRLVYRDVFDNHGPLYTLLNGAQLWLLGGAERFDVVYLLRAEVVLFLLGVAALTFRLARRLHDDRRVAWLATALFTASVVVADKGTEVRPDALQTLWTMMGFIALYGSGPAAPLWAGLCFGVAGTCNVKALVVPAVAVAVWCLTIWRERGVRQAVREGAAVAGGVLGVLGVVVVGFAAAGSLWELWYYNIVFNLNAAASASHFDLSTACVRYALTRQTALVLLTVLGSAGVAVSAVPHLRSRAAPLVVAILVHVWTGYRADMYGQFYVPSAPLVAVVGAAGAPSLASWLTRRWALAARLWLPLLVLMDVWLTAELLVWASRRRFDPNPRLVTEWVLEHLRRDEPVAYTWNDCAGFQFNVDAQYIWCRMPRNFGEASPAQAYGAGFRESLERQQVPVIIATEANLRDVPEDTARYIRAAYVRRSACVLVRRGSRLVDVPRPEDR